MAILKGEREGLIWNMLDYCGVFCSYSKATLFFLKQLVITLYFIDLVHILIFHFTDITQDIKRLWVTLLKLICRLGFGSPSTVPVKGLQHYMHV